MLVMYIENLIAEFLLRYPYMEIPLQIVGLILFSVIGTISFYIMMGLLSKAIIEDK